MKRILILISLVLFSNVLLADNFAWRNDPSNSSWEDPLNWSGTTAIPVNGSNQVVFRSSDNITIGTTSIAPVLNSNQTIGTFTVTSGSITINSTINITGNIGIFSGTVIDGTGQIIAGPVTPIGLTIGGASPGATVNCSISGNIAALNIKNNIFGNNASLILKVFNTSSYYNIGGNTFNGPTTFESAGISGLRLSDLGEDRFNNDLTLISTTGLINASYNYNTIYNGNVVVKSTGSGVYFGNPTATSLITSTLSNTKTITANSFTAGILTLKNFIQQGSSTPQNIILGGTAQISFLSGTGVTSPVSTFDSPITVTATTLTLNGANFKEDATFNASSTSTNLGGNIFQKASYFNFNNTNVNGYWTFGGVNEYIGDATFVNNNVGIIYVGNGTATFGGNSTFDNKAAGQIILAYPTNSVVNFTNPSAKAKMIVRTANGFVRMADNGTTTFNCNVEVNSTAGSIYSVYSGSGKVYLKDGKTISVGDLGFSPGNLGLKNFIQEGTTAQTLLFPCNSNANNLYLQTGSDFSGNLIVQATQVLLQGGIFRGITDITTCFPSAGNIQSVNYEPILFKNDTYIRNKGVGDMSLGNSTYPITFEGNTYFYLTNTGRIYLSSGVGSSTVFSGINKKVSVNISSANNAVGGTFYFSLNGNCQINSDIELSNNANASIVIGSTIGTVSLTEGKKINILPGTFTFGNISFGKFEQLGSTPQNVNLEGSSLITFGNGTIFNGDLSLVSPRIMLYGGSKFKGVSYFEKNSTVAYDNWNGGSEFNIVTFKNSGTQGMNISYSGGGDHYYGDVTFWNATSAQVYVSHTGTSQYDGNILFKNTSNGGINMGGNGGISILAMGKTISAEGFNAGALTLRNLNQKDAVTPQNISLNSNGTALLSFAGGTEFWGDVTASAPSLAISGIFKGVSSFTKTGIGSNSGGATAYFEKEATFTNTGTGDILIGGTDFKFADNVILNNNSTGRILISIATN
ncbi:MAG: hypothetical protein J7604_26055, partial [Sporocytophaga sp.]|uniref:beta strand repeat-containing protein n=1 Tax=Sporocytophaga sp. TaxID=2231183 RepID=UPI001B016A49